WRMRQDLRWDLRVTSSPCVHSSSIGICESQIVMVHGGVISICAIAMRTWKQEQQNGQCRSWDGNNGDIENRESGHFRAKLGCHWRGNQRLRGESPRHAHAHTR